MHELLREGRAVLRPMAGHCRGAAWGPHRPLASASRHQVRRHLTPQVLDTLSTGHPGVCGAGGGVSMQRLRGSWSSLRLGLEGTDDGVDVRLRGMVLPLLHLGRKVDLSLSLERTHVSYLRHLCVLQLHRPQCTVCVGGMEELDFRLRQLRRAAVRESQVGIGLGPLPQLLLKQLLLHHRRRLLVLPLLYVLCELLLLVQIVVREHGLATQLHASRLLLRLLLLLLLRLQGRLHRCGRRPVDQSRPHKQVCLLLNALVLLLGRVVPRNT